MDSLPGLIESRDSGQRYGKLGPGRHHLLTDCRVGSDTFDFYRFSFILIQILNLIPKRQFKINSKNSFSTGQPRLS